VPFVRCTRDKRGYEYVYLMHAFGRRGKPSKPRLLYWFRTPPGVKVGREPFDESVRQTLEAQNPGIVFDWKKLSVIPQAPPDVEYWRERRRSERAAKQARRAEEAVAEADTDEQELPQTETAVESLDASGEEGVEAASTDLVTSHEAVDEQVAEDAPPVAAVGSGSATPGEVRPGGRRRRRRGGRRRGHNRAIGAPDAPAIQDHEPRKSEPAEPPESGGETSKDD
jgi:hypothetical protein